MEKIIYVVWKHETDSEHDLKKRLLEETSRRLLELGVHRLSMCVVDDEVAPATDLRNLTTRPPISGTISMWVDTALRSRHLESAIHAAVARTSGYLVTESVPLVNTSYPASQGQRTPGMCQVAFFKKPARLNYEHWLELWLGKHTRVALETQSIFGYRQNVVARTLTYAAPAYDAIVEELFPAAAMTDPMVFYDAAGDQSKLNERQKVMFESVARFIDFDKFDRIPMSEYVIKA